MIYLPEDQRIFDGLVDSLCRKRKAAASLRELLINIGKYFLGFPYAGGTLEREGEETLVINLREFDCFTFVENVVALARLLKEGRCSFTDYIAALEKIRYRAGVLNGYASRLHYFSDWLFDNEKKGIVKNITGEMGGKRFSREINYMTAHRDDYAGLRNNSPYREMLAVERSLSEKPLYHIPKNELQQFTYAIEDGDLIAITTGAGGLDIMHVGLAIRHKKRIRLLHASEIERKVVVSDTTLYRYLSRRKTMTGIMVGRVMPVCQNGGNL